jgi:serine/threonine protein phosphatase 1
MIIFKNEKYKRILAIGDIHGCSYHLQDLIAAIKPTKDDLIVTMGDYIDRGYYSKDVLDILLNLHEDQNINIVSLRGNHDAMMLMCLDSVSTAEYYPPVGDCDEESVEARKIVAKKDPAQLWFVNQGVATLSSYCDPGSEQLERLKLVDTRVRWPKDYQEPLQNLMAEIIPQDHIDFLQLGCADACETDDLIFVHGGLCPDLPLADQPLFPLHWMRFDEKMEATCVGKEGDLWTYTPARFANPGYWPCLVRGHRGLYGAGISNLRRCIEWPPLAD